MTTLSPRLEAILEKTQTVCFGRFLIDVPADTAVSWGRTMVPWDLTIYPDGVATVDRMADERIAQLKAERNIHHNKPSFVSEEVVQTPKGRIVTGYRSFQSATGLRVDIYSALPPYGIHMWAQDYTDEPQHAADQLRDIAARLRLHSATDIPTEPGLCIEYAFLPDGPGPAADPPEPEHVRVGFRLAQFPDTHLSIYVAPANPYDTSGDSLKRQLEDTEAHARKADRDAPFAGIAFFRRAPREIHDWATGFEVLTRTPDGERSIAHHDFWMKFEGVGNDVLKPYADIQMKTGVGGNAAGAVRPLLSDEEAIALWDRLTSTIRVRPTSVKTSQLAPPRQAPLGDHQATGRICPQTGWWECIDPGVLPQSGRQLIRAGQSMPSAVFHARPDWWQKLRGEQPLARRATVWKLVAYDDNEPEPPVPPAPSGSGR